MTITLTLTDEQMHELLITLTSAPNKTQASRLLAAKLLDVQFERASAA